MDIDTVRKQILEARDARAAIVARLTADVAEGRSVVFFSLNVPGPDKNPPLADALFRAVRQEVAAALGGGRVAGEGHDALGPWAAVVSGEPARAAKRRCVAIEEATAAGRLVDLDVYGRRPSPPVPWPRAALGLPPRRCLVCDEPAVDCIRRGRHTGEELRRSVEALLRAQHGARCAAALARAARTELELTPKPGLVDRRDNGSHPDLSFELMAQSVDLLPEYYADVLAISRTIGPRPGGAGLEACVAAGRRAEERMMAAIHSNAHRGYIFLSGLVLLAAASGAASREEMRAGIAEIASRILHGRRASGDAGGHSRHDAWPEASVLPPQVRHGADLRRRLGVGGIHGEALAGLPSVFDHGLPALEHAFRSFASVETAYHFLMATLMTRVEDTTALHRCGSSGLQRLRADGRRLQAAIETGDDYLSLLASLNDEYRAAGLTMGGVADCMAVTMGLQEQGFAAG